MSPVRVRGRRVRRRVDLALQGGGAHGAFTWASVSRLHRIGWNAADDWLSRDAAHLGRRPTMRLEGEAPPRRRGPAVPDASR